MTAPVTDEATVLAEFTKDFKRLQQQKAKPNGGVEARTLLNIAMDLGEHYATSQDRALTLPDLSADAEANKLHLVFNLIARRKSKLIGRLCALGGVYRATPDKRDPKAFADAKLVDRLIKALDKKLDQPSRDREIFDWLLRGGTAFEYVPWVPNATLETMPQFDESTNELLYRDLIASQGQEDPGVIIPESQVEALVAQGRAPESFEVYEEVKEVGEVGSEILGPLNVFVDQSVRSIEDLAPDQAVYIAKFRTQGWIRENYGDAAVDGDPDKGIDPLAPDRDLQIVTTTINQNGASVAGVSLKDMIPLIQGSVGPDDPPMNLVIERYQPASRQWPRGRYSVFVPGKRLLYDGENKYEEVPLVDFHFEPVTVDFWTKDFITDLIAPQRFLNKRISQLGEQSNASIYDKVLLGPGLHATDIPSDYPGFVEGGVAENGQPLVQRLPGPQLPGWFMESIALVLKLTDDLSGGNDLFQEHKFPGQLRGPLAVPMLQEIIDTQWGPLYQHIGERMARVKQMRINRVKQFYPAIRTLHYVDRDQRDEVLEFHTEKVLRAGTSYAISVDRSSLLPELRALREARVRERLESPLNVLYIDERTGALDKSKVAEDLHFGDLGRESREAQYRKLGAEIVSLLWRGEPIPPVLPFYDHAVMLDELEAAMATTEFLRASPQVQQAFIQRWTEHNQFLQQQAQAQQQAQQGWMIQNAVAQATQQAAAQAAAEAVEMAMAQLQAQIQRAPQVPTEVSQALSRGAVAQVDQEGRGGGRPPAA